MPAPNSYAALGLTLPQPRSGFEVARRGNLIPNASFIPPRNVNTSSQNYHEALRETPDRTPIPAQSLDFRRIISGFNREKLSALGRYLYDNNGRVYYAVETIANYSVPVVPQSASPNPEWNTLADDYFETWAQVADFSGRFDFWKLQRFLSTSSDTDGDIGAMFVSENGLPQLQLIDGWRIRNRKKNFQDQFDGVRVDAKGRLVGYWVDQPDGAIPIPAGQMYLFGDSCRYSEFRNLSPLKRGSNDIRDVTDIKAFEKIATKIGSALSAVIETEGGVLEEDVWGNDTGDEDGDSPGNQPPDDATPQERKITFAELLGGDIPVLGEGEKMHQLTNLREGGKVNDFVIFLVGEFVCGLALPPAFYLDEKLTGPNQRSVNGKAQRQFDNRQSDMARFVLWCRKRVIADGIARGALRSQAGWDKAEWNGPARLSIDSGEDRSQEREDVDHALMTRQQHYANRALNNVRETKQWFAERENILLKAKEISKKLDVPIELCLPTLGTTKSTPPKEQQGGQEKKGTKE